MKPIAMTGKQPTCPQPGTEHDQGAVYWITGLAGTGKTTLAELLAARLREAGRAVVLLDGGALRKTLFWDVGYSKQERADLGRRYTRLASLIANQGIDVVCATISMFPEVWERNRREFCVYHEILLRAPLQVRERRKPELYRSDPDDDQTYVVGRAEPPTEPPAADVIMNNDGSKRPLELVEEILSRLSTDRARKDASGA